MRLSYVSAAALLCAALPAQKALHSFEKIQLDADFYSEGGTFGDINGDGVGDAISGPFWYAGPEFQQRHEIYEPAIWDISGYSKNFFAFVYDFNKDGAQDIFFIGFPGEDASWFENPRGEERHWTRHQVFDVVDNESPTFEDLTGDGVPELICQSEDRLGYAAPDWSDPTKPWVFHPISSTGLGAKFTHGLGIGDVDGDGRTDILARTGWWRQPESLDGDPEWQHGAFQFGGRGGAQMYVYDVDGDGDNDVISSWNAHGFGLFWYEQVLADRAISFVQHRIMGEFADESPYGLVIGNLHAIDLVDMDGDGVKDIVTGSRYWAHNGNDIADRQPPLVYWFQLLRPEQGKGVQFIPHEIDDDSGVGTQVVARDVNGDDLPDVIVGNKNGTFVHIHRTRAVTNAAYYEAQRAAFTKMRGISVRIDRSTGTLPVGADGEPLNLDFEAGDLSDWTASGEAFAGMPNRGDTVQPRRPGSSSDHQGEFWIGTYEVEESDRSQGTLTSEPFEVTAPFASFLIGGGRATATRVELVRGDSGEIVFVGSGLNREAMRPLYLEVSEHQGQQIFIRLVDEDAGGWGHINFDDFRFHAENPVTRERIEEDQVAMAEGLLPLEAAERMTVPDGFSVELVAGEPELHQPIAFCLDDKARLWVAEAHSYPERRSDGTGEDKILVFEDSNGDGTYDRRTVFVDNLNLVSGLEVGFGGVWVGAAPYLMFIPDRDDDLVPDGEPEILLDGWGYQDTHETLNAFNWGPDGWLYGCHGVFTHSRVGPPGTPDEEREPLNAGVWRYHPTRHEFEVFAWGSSNPWGVDFDDHGQAVITACVIPHLFHTIQGGRYHRQAGQHFNRYVYDDIKTVADHLHYLGEWAHSGNGVSSSVGGGHAHCGLMIYLGDSFPEEYRGGVFMSNIHGNRINMDTLARSGSGFTGSHGDDFLMANDPWFRGINLRYGPDGNVFLIDWYDEQACHDRTPETWDRTNGRMYKVSYGEPQNISVDLRAMSDAELVAMQLHENDWYVRVARRVLQERGGNPEVHAALTAILNDNPDTTRKLRALWALHVTGGVTEDLSLAQMASDDEYLRAWSIQLALESGPVSAEVRSRMATMAGGDPSPLVRLYLASGLQRLPLADRWPIVEGLAQREEDRDDQNLPLMYWYGIEPLVAADPERALQLAWNTRLPPLSDFILRRMADGADASLEPMVTALAETDDEQRIGAVLDAMATGLETRDGVAMPAGWPAVADRLMQNTAIRDQAMAVALMFGDTTAAPYLRGILAEPAQDLERRIDALGNLVSMRDPELVPLLRDLVDEPAIAAPAIRALAAYEDAQIPGLLLERYDALDVEARAAAVSTLSSRVVYAKALLTAMSDGRVPTAVLDSATTRRQISQLGDPEVDALMTTAWGRSALPTADKQTEINRYKSFLTEEFLAAADLSRGRALFSSTCMSCHVLFGTGTELAPDLTGSNRADLDYVLSNAIDPNGEVGNQYLQTLVTLKDGRLLAGMVTDRTDESLTLRNENETQIVRMSEIAELDGQPAIQQSQNSLMAEGLLAPFANEEVRDLVAYLASPVQVPMLATEDNLELFFDGESLANWEADPAIWRVEDGEIVGSATEGLAENDFAKSQMIFGDFRLIASVKLVGNRGNSGIQFRSEPHGAVEMKGYQADIGVDWWGKLYEENGRGLLWEEPGDEHVDEGEWNTYEILAIGDTIKTAINGELCVDLQDASGARQGMIGLQVHFGDPTEVRFRDFQLELNPEPEMWTTGGGLGLGAWLLFGVGLGALCVLIAIRYSRKH